MPDPPPNSRGTPSNPANRFESVRREAEPGLPAEDRAAWDVDPSPATEFIPDLTQTALTRNDSPDIGFTWSLNPYRGCEHGCAYCYARPFHEYLGFSAGLDFETRILVKHRLPELLRSELASPRWQPDAIALSGVTDCYQPVERRLGITRRCLEVLAEFRNPVGIVTKNALVTRDIDVLSELARHRAVAVFVSLTTLDPELRRVLEPRTSPPAARLDAIRRLAAAGIPVGVMVAPIIPALNDHEVPRLVEAAVGAGASFAGRVVLRLPLGVAPLFSDWLERHYPDRRDKVLNGIRELRGGGLNDARFVSRMTGEGPRARQIAQMFDVACRRAGIAGAWPGLSTGAFRRREPGQMELFDGPGQGTV